MSEQHTSRQCRGFAAKGVDLVVNQKRTIDWVLANRSEWFTSPETRHLFYGTVRHYQSLVELIDPLLNKPLRDKDSAVYCLMLVGAYQLKLADTPAHAAINETVNATGNISRPWARGLVNAVLRKVTSLDIKIDQTFGHPQWLADAIHIAWPDRAESILFSDGLRAPMILRVNLSKITRENYLKRLFDNGISCIQGDAEQSIILDEPQPSSTLPGWLDGEVAVQDMGAQFAATLALSKLPEPAKTIDVEPQHSKRILDACAAPGGKLAHLIEINGIKTRVNDSGATLPQVVAVDINPERVAQTEAILARLGHTCTLKVGDATTLSWWDNEYFDHILLDAPCSGTGTIRRHPDIKLLLKESAISEHAELQLQILNNLWRTLSPGGTLLYCTCSILPIENDGVIRQFIERPDINAQVCSIDLPTGQATKHGWQLLPTDPNTDGFYYARLQKVA